jgi:SAM-dependent methyltransferase
MPYDGGRFSAVMSNSIVHHIPDPARVLSEIVRVTAPGGLMFVRDLMRPAEEHEVHERVKQYAADANDHQRSMFEASLRAALSLDEIRALVAQLGMSPSAVQATSDRHWTLVSRK